MAEGTEEGHDAAAASAGPTIAAAAIAAPVPVKAEIGSTGGAFQPPPAFAAGLPPIPAVLGGAALPQAGLAVAGLASTPTGGSGRGAAEALHHTASLRCAALVCRGCRECDAPSQSPRHRCFPLGWTPQHQNLQQLALRTARFSAISAIPFIALKIHAFCVQQVRILKVSSLSTCDCHANATVLLRPQAYFVHHLRRRQHQLSARRQRTPDIAARHGGRPKRRRHQGGAAASAQVNFQYPFIPAPLEHHVSSCALKTAPSPEEERPC